MNYELFIQKLHFLWVKLLEVLIEATTFARARETHLPEGFINAVADVGDSLAQPRLTHVNVAIGVNEWAAELTCLCRH